MQYITELRQSLSDTAISRELGLSLSGVQHYTQGRSKKPNPRILDYVNDRIERYKLSSRPSLEQYREEKYDLLRVMYEAELRETGEYEGMDLGEVNDGRDEFILDSYKNM